MCRDEGIPTYGICRNHRSRHKNTTQNTTISQPLCKVGVSSPRQIHRTQRNPPEPGRVCFLTHRKQISNPNPSVTAQQLWMILLQHSTSFEITAAAIDHNTQDRQYDGYFKNYLYYTHPIPIHLSISSSITL